ncbi:MAG TPA: hypothetical protein EYP17_07660 [Candidatus Latescibacteria bacterium]|nr:hypothetical protein [Candidatus Latescibacterota bacterium]
MLGLMGVLTFLLALPVHGRPTVGLALSGGGARGLAQIGVLKTLERAGVRVDRIAGTSIGAVVGGLYAAGYSAEEIEALARRVDWAALIDDAPPRTSLSPGQRAEEDRRVLQLRFEWLRPELPKGWTKGQYLAHFLWSLTARASYLCDGDFDRLPIPYRAVATDILTGERVAIGEGDLAEAMLASVSVPLLFVPHTWRGRWLADGGLREPVPVKTAREMGADFVIAVDTSAPLRTEEALRTPLDIADQATTILMAEQLERQLGGADFVVRLRLEGYTSLDYRRADSLIALGEREMEARIGELLGLLGGLSCGKDGRSGGISGNVEFEGNTLISDEELREAMRAGWEAGLGPEEAVEREYIRRGYVLATVHREGDDLFVDEGRVVRLEVEGNRITRRYVVLREFPLKVGDAFQIDEVSRGVEQIYGTGLFDRVSVRLRREEGGVALTLSVQEHLYSLARLGLHFDRERRSEVLAELGYDNLFGTGGRLRSSVVLGERRQVYQVGFRMDRFFWTYWTFSLYVKHRVKRGYIFEEGEEVGEYRERLGLVLASFGRQIRRLGTMAIDVRDEGGRIESVWGTGYPKGKFKVRAARIGVLFDTLDRYPFPRRGRRTRVFWERGGFGGPEYIKIGFFSESYQTFLRRNTLGIKLRWEVGSPDLPFPEQFTLGGGRELFGYREEEERGWRVFSLHLEYRYWMPRYTHIGLRIDVGRIWPSTDLRLAFGGMIALETMIGPISLSYGRSLDGRGRLYLSTGSQF